MGHAIALLGNAARLILLVGEQHVHHVHDLGLVILQLTLGHHIELLQHAAPEALALIRCIHLVQHHLLDLSCRRRRWRGEGSFSQEHSLLCLLTALRLGITVLSKGVDHFDHLA